MKLLLDTHIFLWYVSNDAKLPERYRDAIRDPANIAYLSAASVWEAVIKNSLGKLPLPKPAAELLPELRELHRIESLPIGEGELRVLATLDPIHRDPFDRLIVAQAIHYNCTLITVDESLHHFPVPILDR